MQVACLGASEISTFLASDIFAFSYRVVSPEGEIKRNAGGKGVRKARGKKENSQMRVNTKTTAAAGPTKA